MRIVIPLSCNFAPQGGWRVLSELANNWINQGNEVSFLVHKSSPLPYFPTNAHLIWFDNKGRIFNKNNTNYLRPKTGYFGISFALIKALRHVECEIILATLSLSTWPIILSGNRAKKFYYVQAYEPDYYPINNIFNVIYWILSKVSYYLNFKIIVNSKYYLNYKGIKASDFVYPGVDFSIFNTRDKLKTIDKLVLGTIGRVEKIKGTNYIIEAFHQLRREFGCSVELHVAFGNPSLKNIEGIFIIDCENDLDLASFYKSIDIYICAANYQLGAIHYPVLEAMACGIPLITTGYYPSNNDNAWIISINNSKEIVDSVKMVMKNKNLADEKVKNALNSLREFDWEIVSSKMINIFNNI